MTARPTSFGDRLAAMVAKELAAADGDAAHYADILEGLCHSLGCVAAHACYGRADGIDTMLEGATAYIYEVAAEKAPLAYTLAIGRRKRGRTAP